MVCFLFRENPTKFFPAQHYRNCHNTVNDMFMSVAMAKSHGIDKFLFFLNTSKPLEQMYGIVCSMKGGNVNFDFLGLTQHVGTAGGLSQVYARHPEWDTMARKLMSTVNHKNCRSWNGDTSVANVNIVRCRRIGVIRALAALKKCGIFSGEDLDINLIQREESGVCMLHPYHKSVGVLAGAQTLVDPTSATDDVDVEVSLSEGRGAQDQATMAKETNKPQDGADSAELDHECCTLKVAALLHEEDVSIA